VAIPDRIGRYRVVGLLGTGASSAVFRAHDPELDIDVAVKVLADNLSHREDLVQRFLREARLLRTITDPRVVAVHDVGVLESGQPYLVMDLVDGGSLAERAAAVDASGARVRPEALVATGLELASAVEAVAAHGLVHGDLKPENIFIGGDGRTAPRGAFVGPGERLVVGDFGIAADAGGDAGGAGTAGYAAPEQERASDVDVRTDLYAAAAVLFRLATGSPPRGPWPQETAGAHMPLRQFFSTALAADPARRPRDVDAWRDALAHAGGRHLPTRWVVLAGAAAIAVAVVLLLWMWPSAPRLVAPSGIAAGAAGGVVVADPGSRSVLSVSAGGEVKTVAGDTGDVVAVAPTESGPMFVADRDGDRLLRIERGKVAVVAGTGEAGFSGDGGPATDAQLARPSGVAVADDDTVFVSDTENDRIRRVNPDGTIDTLAGTGQPGFSGDGGPASDAQLDAPEGLAVTEDGALLVADTGNNRVRRISRGGTITTVAGIGTEGFSGDGGQAVDAQLARPTSVAVAADRTILVADTANGRIRRVLRDGTITTVAGDLSGPEGVAAVEDVVWASDTGAGRVTPVDPVT